ncbi:hypothetical protein QFZ20_004615 [Flavobacterium sp. W4I14]|nr:hypothetical protein [Flavobacterium sp. W4I14]
MSFSKVVYVRYFPLTAKVYSDFYLEEVEKCGISVEYWDLTKIFFRSDFEQEDSSHLVTTKKFNSYATLEQAIKESSNPDTLFVSIMTFESRVEKLFRIFTKYNSQISVFGRNMFPLASGKSASFISRLMRITPAKLIEYIKIKRLKKAKDLNRIKRYDYVFLGGKLGYEGIGNTNYEELQYSKIIQVNSDDYDSCLALKNQPSIFSHQYILFLDEYLPLHPDTHLLNIKNIKPEEYYPQLCEYFDRVESEFKMPVIIAAHPKALRYKTEDFFNGRKVIFGKSAELSNGAEFVLAHDTTSINYPIALDKRIHFISSKNIEKGINIVHQNVLHFAEYLGCNFQWFDKQEKINLIQSVPVENYKRYKYEFQTSPDTENQMSKDIFISFLKNSCD